MYIKVAFQMNFYIAKIMAGNKLLIFFLSKMYRHENLVL